MGRIYTRFFYLIKHIHWYHAAGLLLVVRHNGMRLMEIWDQRSD